MGIDLLASYSAKGVKHILSKKVKLYTLEEYEHCFIRIYKEEVTIQQANEFAESIMQSIDFMVHPHPDHKRTILTGVLIAEKGCSAAVNDFVAAYHNQRIFWFFMHGWCEARLVLADLRQGAVVHSKRRTSRHLGKMYNIPVTAEAKELQE